jgi:hypothetical protein
MTDPFPAFTQFLTNILTYLIFIGIIFATISGIVAGILFLPIWGFSDRRTSAGAIALRLTVVGLIIILLAVPARNALLKFFPPPTALPPLPPIATPATPQATPRSTFGGP